VNAVSCGWYAWYLGVWIVAGLSVVCHICCQVAILVLECSCGLVSRWPFMSFVCFLVLCVILGFQCACRGLRAVRVSLRPLCQVVHMVSFMLLVCCLYVCFHLAVRMVISMVLIFVSKLVSCVPYLLSGGHV